MRVKVKTGKREAKVEELGAGEYVVQVRARREKGRANDEMLRVLAGHLGMAPSRLRIVSGARSSNKIIEYA